MHQTAADGRQLEEALKGLVKMIKASRFYPPGHPALQTAAGEALAAFSPLLARGELSLAVHKEGFSLAERAVAPANQPLQKLALGLFARRIHRLLILTDLSAADLRRFVGCLNLSPADIQTRGGIQEVLSAARISTLWANETHLEGVLSRKEQIEADKEAHPETGEALDAAPPLPQQEAERDLAEVYSELRREKQEERFQALLRELIPLVPPSLSEAGRPLILATFILLCLNASTRTTSEVRRTHARHALSKLTSDEVLAFLSDFLCSRDLGTKDRGNLTKVLAFLGTKAARHLMNRLAAEEDSAARRTLADVLARQGAAAVPVLTGYLEDDRWYVVRNAVAILGEIRDHQVAAHLPPLLQHPDVRVRRETIRALTRIGGEKAVGILLQVVEGNDPELRRQGLLSLGAMKSPAAVPALIKLVQRPDPKLKMADETREAIKALGEIGSADAVPALLQVLSRSSFLRRAQYNEIRATAALALGELGSMEPLPALEKAAEDRSEGVARAAAQALKQLNRGKRNDPGIA